MMERKMNWGRRLTALALCLCTVLSILPLPARAEEPEETRTEIAETAAQTEAVEETGETVVETEETEAAEETEATEAVVEDPEEPVKAPARPAPRPVGPELTAESGEYQAKAQTFLDNALPEDTELRMTVLSEENYGNCWDEVEAALETPLTEAYFFDLSLLSGENQVEPAAGTVTVTLTLPQELAAGFVDAVHFRRNYVARLDAQVDGTQVTFQTDSFSKFGVIVRESRVPNGGWGALAKPDDKVTVTVFDKGNKTSKQYDDVDKNITVQAFLDANNIHPQDTIGPDGYPTECFLRWEKRNNNVINVTDTIEKIGQGQTYELHQVWGNPYTLTFNLGDATGENLDPAPPVSIRVHPGDSVAKSPLKELPQLTWTKADGTVMKFEGWFTERTNGTPFTKDTPINSSRTVYARWTEPHVTISFEVGTDAPNGVKPDSISVTPNATVDTLPSPEWKNADGQTVKYFMGWYKDADCTEENKFDPTQSVGEIDFTLYAKWLAPVTITFYMGGAIEGQDPPKAPETITLRPNSMISKMPENPVWNVDGVLFRKFMGWYTNADCTQEFKASEAVGEDNIDLYAKWAAPVTIHFDVGEALDGYQPPQAPGDMIVAEGATGLTLPDVKWLDTDRTALYFLKGWYYLNADGGEMDFTSETVVSGNMTLYARWEKATEDNTVIVSFHYTEGGGDLIVMTRQVMHGQTVQEPAGPIAKDRLFRGWATAQQTPENYETDPEIFDFSTSIKNNQDLYAWYSEMCTVTFAMGGGRAIPPLTVMKGDAINRDELDAKADRYGYQLVSWTTDEENQFPFDFDTPITKNITLYANWEALWAKVHVVELFEDANENIYNDPSQIADWTIEAPVGSYVNVAALARGLSDAARYNADHDIVYSATPSPASTDTLPVIGTIPDSRADPTLTNGDTTHYFQFLGSPKDVKVRPDGNTTLYVYYRRVRVTLKFDFTPGNPNVTDGATKEYPTTTHAEINPAIDQADIDAYHVSWENKGNGFVYQFTAKYKQQIADVWPRNIWLNLTPVTTNNREFNAWSRPGDGLQQTSLMHSMESNLIGKDDYHYDENGQLYFESTSNALGKANKLVHIWLLYVLDTLPGETPDFTYNGKNYTVRSQGGQLAFMEQYATYKSISIADAMFNNTANVIVAFNQPYKNSYTLDSTNYYAPLSDTSTEILGFTAAVYLNGAVYLNTKQGNGADKGQKISVYDSNTQTILSIFKANFPEDKFPDFHKDIAESSSTYHCNFQVLPYTRHKVTLKVHPNHPAYDDTYTQNCMAEEKIFDNKDGNFDYFNNEPHPDYLLKFVYENNQWRPYTGTDGIEAEFEATHRFVGWYTTPSFSAGTEFVPYEDERIFFDMDLYAKWEPIENQVQYHVLDFVHQEGFAEDAILTDYKLGLVPNLKPPAELTQNFIGWYWYSPDDPDRLVAFDFEQQVGKNFTQDGVLHLYAQFKPVQCTVTYSRGDNANLSPEPVVDSSEYWLDTICVLKEPENVWTETTDFGKTFLGWERNGTYYRPGQRVVITAPTMDFIAQWADNPVKLIYNGNGAAQANVEELMEVNKAHPVWNNLVVNPDYKPEDPNSQWIPHFTWEGHKLLGWSKTPTGGVDYALNGATIIPEEGETEIILYAVWESQVTITYHPNGMAVIPQTPNQTVHRPNEETAVWNNKVFGGADYFTNEGYTFGGWSTDPDPEEGTRYSPGEKITLTEDILTDGNLNLYAIWERDDTEDAFPRVVYHSNPPFNGPTDEIAYEKGTYDSSLPIWTNTTGNTTPVFKYDGYQFLGWSLKKNIDGPDENCAVEDWEGQIVDDHSNVKMIYLNQEEYREVEYFAVWGQSPGVKVQVKKLVEGSLGDTKKSFNFTMSYTDAENTVHNESFDLVHGQTSAEFIVPKGVSLTITETNANDYTMIYNNVSCGDHTAKVTLPEPAPADPVVITITNKKDPTPDTGVSLDALPALILLAVSVLGGAALLFRRRRFL